MLTLTRGRNLLARKNWAAPQLCAAPLSRALSSSTPHYSMRQPLHMSEISCENLYMMAKLEGPVQAAAARERMRREIMRVDGVDYPDATPKLLELNQARCRSCAASHQHSKGLPSHDRAPSRTQVNSSGLFLKKLPYQLTWFAAVAGAPLLGF